MVRNLEPDRSTRSETSALTETSHTVTFPPDCHNDWTGYTRTFSVRWRTTNAHLGRIAAYATFRTDDDSDCDKGDTAAGPVFDPRERERLARRLVDSLPETIRLWEDPHQPIVECLNAVAKTLLLESVMA